MTWWRSRAATLVVVIATAVGVAAVAPRLRFTTQITEFFPDSREASAQLAAVLAQSDTARIMAIDLSLHPNAALAAPQSVRDLAQSLVAFLQTLPEVARVTSGITERDATTVLEFLQAWPATTFVPATAYTEAELRARLSELRDSLAGPLGAVVRRTAPQDPLGGIWHALRALRAFQAAPIVDDDGIVVTADRRHAFIFVETKAAPFDSAAQRQFQSTLRGWLERSAPAARLQTAGAAQFAIASEAQIKGDVNRIGIVSTIGIVAVFVLLFGSVRMIAVGFAPMLFGSAIAIVACHAWFGEIHGITVAFGTSLLGVGLDYTEHYFAHFVLTPTVPAAITMRRVAPSIALGAVTTVIGFSGIAASGLPGLRQMATFSAIAIVAAMAATLWLLPPWMPAGYQPPRSVAVLHRGVLAISRWLRRIRWSRGARIAMVTTASGLLALGASRVRFSDNVNMLVDESGPHVAEDRAVRSRLGPEAEAFAVINAVNDEALMVAIGTATAELEAARHRGDLKGFLPLGLFTPSAAEQLARLDAARSHVMVLRDAMTALDFLPDQFQAFWDTVANAPARFLTLADVRGSPLSPVLGPWLPSPSAAGSVALIPIHGVSDAAALRARVTSATIVVPADAMAELFRNVRTTTIAASALGLIAIAALLLWRYRRPRTVAIALTPALLACMATVCTLGALGMALTILHVMSLLLVVSLGVDFGIFLVDSGATPEDSSHAVVSIVTASVTTVLSFGLLSVSQSPGLAALGITITLGVTYSLGICVVMASLIAHRSQPMRSEA